MSARIRIALPLVQSAVAAALITANRMRADSLMSPSWNKPEIQICYGLNAPAALVVHVLREAAYLSVPNPHQIELVIDTVIYVALVWITWFVVGVEIDGNGRRALVA